MVTAGVFLVLKFSFAIAASPAASGLLLFFSVTTLFFGAIVACFQFDIKKIIAYSTTSQLGLMFLAASVSAYNLAIFHFFNHAFFKCLLFLLAGVVIHELKNEQDIRKMGGLMHKMPFTFVCFFIGSLSLAGFPFFSGAVSKDLIFSVTDHIALCEDGTWGAAFFYISLRLSSVLTIVYSARLIFYVFLGDYNYKRGLLGRGYYDTALKNPFYLWPITVLTVLSVVSGKAFKKFFIHSEDIFIGVENDVFVCDFAQEAIICTEFNYLSWVISFGGVLAAAYTLHLLQKQGKDELFYVEHRPRLYRLYCFFNRKCYIDDFYAHFVVRPVFLFAHVLRKTFERGLFMAPLPLLSKLASESRRAFTPVSPRSEFF
jgi:NADH-quinone oxidoreductase subunit L